MTRTSTLRLAVVAAILTTAAGCDSISASLFRPAAAAPDVAPPVFSDPRPAPGTVVNTEVFTIQVADPEEGGVEGSGVDPARVEAAVTGGGVLPVAVNLPSVTVLLTGVPEGPVTVALTARDRAGNSAVHLFQAVLDRTPPPLAFLVQAPTLITSSDATARIDLTVQVGADSNYQSGQLEIRVAGPDRVCGTADDAAVPTSVVAQPVRALATPGVHAFQFLLNNPVPRGGQPQTILYCWVATARDTARSLTGEPANNVSRISSATAVTWRPPA